MSPGDSRLPTRPPCPPRRAPRPPDIQHQRPGPMHWTILLCAIILAGVSFIGGRMTAPDQPVVLDREAAMAVGPPEGPGGRLDPDYRDLVISTLQHALDSAARDGAAARMHPPIPPERLGDSNQHSQQEK